MHVCVLTVNLFRKLPIVLLLLKENLNSINLINVLVCVFSSTQQHSWMAPGSVTGLDGARNLTWDCYMQSKDSNPMSCLHNPNKLLFGLFFLVQLFYFFSPSQPKTGFSEICGSFVLCKKSKTS